MPIMASDVAYQALQQQCDALIRKHDQYRSNVIRILTEMERNVTNEGDEKYRLLGIKKDEALGKINDVGRAGYELMRVGQGTLEQIRRIKQM